jgi:hypothetical protein
LLQTTLEAAGELPLDQSGYEATWAAFSKAGRTRFEHQLWREVEFPPLLQLWVSLVETELNQNSLTKNGSWFKREEGKMQPESIEYKETRTNRTRTEVEIANWYLESEQKGSFKNTNYADTGSDEFSKILKYLIEERSQSLSLKNQLGKRDATIDSKQSEERIKKPTRAEKLEIRKGELPEVRWEDLEKKDMTAAQIIEDKKNKLGTNEDLGFKKSLSDAAWYNVKEKIGDEAEIKDPIRIGKTQRSQWHRYAVTLRGKTREGNRYGIIKEELNKINEG